MEGGGNYRVDEGGGFLQPTSVCFLSDTAHRCMSLENRWSGYVRLHNEQIFFSLHDIFKDNFFVYFFFFF